MSRTLPILCSASVVRNILSGAQTEDRRPIRNPDGWHLANPDATRIGCYQTAPPHFFADRYLTHPYAVGDTLYVRETWRPYIRGWSSHVQYQAGTEHRPDRPVVGAGLGPDESDAAMEWQAKRGGVLDIECRDPAPIRWFPSIHMPKWAARIHLRVLSVGVERVGDITLAGARAEGCADVEDFARLWIKLYGIWSDNPWVWVTKFERVPS